VFAVLATAGRAMEILRLIKSSLVLLPTLAAALGVVAQLHAQGPPAGPLFGQFPGPPPTTSSGRPVPVRQRAVSINFQRLRDSLPAAAGGNNATNRLHLNLFPDADFTAVRDRVETTDTGYVWVGKLEGVAESQVTLAVSGTAATGSVMSGSVVTPTVAYTMHFSPAGAHVVEQVNLNAFPPELPSLTPPPSVEGARAAAAVADSIPAAALDDGSLIDLLVVYTPAARVAAGGTAAMNSLIDLGVTETNQAYANTGAIQRLRLRRKEEIAYTETGDMFTDLPRLRATSDGFMDSVHSLRNTYGADVTQLIVNSPDACGLAYVMSTLGAAFEDDAFGLTYYPCISPNYSFGHEMGHNMGLQHDTYVSPSGSAFAYGHGYVNQAALVGGAPIDKRWRTIMAYNDQCAASGFTCSRLLYFSNPNNTNTGDPMGNVNTAYEGLALDNSRVTVANFRASILEPLDNFGNARSIFTNNFSDTLTTLSFTTEGTDPTPDCGGGVKQKSAWYRFTPGVNGVGTLDTFGSSYDTILSVYTGSTGSFVSAGCNDDANAAPQSKLVFNVTAGTTYSIMISAKAADGGTLLLNVSVPIDKKRRGQLTSD
jgi:peptidyl-Asp metalloendopeptidase